MDPQVQPEQSVQPVQAVVNPIPPQKNYLLLGIFVLIAALLGSGATYLALQSKTQTEPQPTPIVQVTPSPTPDETANWEIYRNDQYKFSFSYPKDFIFELPNDPLTKDKFITILLNRNKSNFIQINAKLDKQYRNPADVFLDTPSNGKSTIGSYIWYTFYLPNGYGDGPEPEKSPIYGYQIELNDILYSVSFYNVRSATPEQEKLLSTFRFD